MALGALHTLPSNGECDCSKPLLCLPYLLHVPIEHIEDPLGPTLDDGYDVAVVRVRDRLPYYAVVLVGDLFRLDVVS